MNEIKLRDLTPAQVAMMEKIWNLDEQEEFDRFLRNLSQEDRWMVATLCIMLGNEYLEVDIMSMKSYPTAETWLNSIGVATV